MFLIVKKILIIYQHIFFPSVNNKIRNYSKAKL